MIQLAPVDHITRFHLMLYVFHPSHIEPPLRDKIEGHLDVCGTCASAYEGRLRGLPRQLRQDVLFERRDHILQHPYLYFHFNGVDQQLHAAGFHCRELIEQEIWIDCLPYLEAHETHDIETGRLFPVPAARVLRHVTPRRAELFAVYRMEG